MRQSSPVPGRQRWRQFMAFAAIGLLATVIQYAVLFVSVRLWHANPVVGSSAGFLISAAFNYLLNYHFTFKSTSPHLSAATRFVIIASAAFVLNGAIMFALTQWLHVRYLIAQLLATAAVLVWNFLGSALWTFRARERP
jgi:putative flippase GtrA